MSAPSYSLWVCPNGHQRQEPPQDEGALVFCQVLQRTRPRWRICGWQMSRRLIVTTDPEVSGDC